MKTFEDKVDAAVHAAFMQLGLSVANNIDTAELLNDYITGLVRNIVTSDDEDEDEEIDEGVLRTVLPEDADWILAKGN